MMTYTATGGLNIGGCAEISVVYAYISPFNVSDIVYSLKAAQKGYLVAVAIKKIRIVDSSGTIIFQDSFNKSWNSGDLVGETTAQSLAVAFWQNEVMALEEAAEKCSV